MFLAAPSDGSTIICNNTSHAARVKFSEHAHDEAKLYITKGRRRALTAARILAEGHAAPNPPDVLPRHRELQLQEMSTPSRHCSPVHPDPDTCDGVMALIGVELSEWEKGTQSAIHTCVKISRFVEIGKALLSSRPPHDAIE